MVNCRSYKFTCKKTHKIFCKSFLPQSSIKKCLGRHAQDASKVIIAMKWCKAKIRSFRTEERRKVKNYMLTKLLTCWLSKSFIHLNIYLYMVGVGYQSSPKSSKLHNNILSPENHDGYEASTSWRNRECLQKTSCYTGKFTFTIHAKQTIISKFLFSVPLSESRNSHDALTFGRATSDGLQAFLNQESHHKRRLHRWWNRMRLSTTNKVCM